MARGGRTRDPAQVWVDDWEVSGGPAMGGMRFRVTCLDSRIDHIAWHEICAMFGEIRGGFVETDAQGQSRRSAVAYFKNAAVARYAAYVLENMVCIPDGPRLRVESPHPLTNLIGKWQTMRGEYVHITRVEPDPRCYIVIFRGSKLGCLGKSLDGDGLRLYPLSFADAFETVVCWEGDSIDVPAGAKLIEAVYGDLAHDGGATQDILDEFMWSYPEGEAFSWKVGNEFGDALLSDPCPGVTKQARLKWRKPPEEADAFEISLEVVMEATLSPDGATIHWEETYPWREIGATHAWTLTPEYVELWKMQDDAFDL